MVAIGAGLCAHMWFAKVEYANGEVVSAERYLREVEDAVLDIMLGEIFGLRGVGSVDPITLFYILQRFTYCGSAIEVGDAHVFCYPQDIEIDGPNGVTELVPLLAEKTRGASSSKFRVRTFEESGGVLGIGEDGKLAQFVDAVHRLSWLLDKAKLENGILSRSGSFD